MTSTVNSTVKLSPSMLPLDEFIVFTDSSFFTQLNAPSALPSPTEVRALKNIYHDQSHAHLIQFPSLHLIVKYGRTITIAEGQCLWAIRHLLIGVVPVPEVYGWCRDSGEVFIYMQLVRGRTLEELWQTLETQEKANVCEELRLIVNALSHLEQEPSDQFIGHIGRQPLLDIIFTSSSSPTAGPFPTVSSFHDFFVDPRSVHNHTLGESPHPMRSELCDNAAIKFTHGDLHPSNIIISTGGDETSPSPSRIVAIVDWHQSGWFPEYWEYCKARWTAKIGSEWEVEYLPRFLEPSKQYNYWDYFVLSLGV